MPRRRSSRGRSGPAARYRWVDRQNAVETVVTAGALAAIDMLGPITETSKAGITIVRMLLWLFVRAVAVNETVEFAHGVCNVSDQAMTSGDVPEPGLDNPGWYVFENGMFRSGADIGFPAFQRAYDIRTARRLRGADQTLVHTIRNSSAVRSLSYTVGSRLLLKLP